MKKSEIRDAIFEAERFTARAKDLLDALSAQKVWSHEKGEYALHDEVYPNSTNEVNYRKPKESGALRRASLDLSRSLAQMRRS